MSLLHQLVFPHPCHVNSISTLVADLSLNNQHNISQKKTICPLWWVSFSYWGRIKTTQVSNGMAAFARHCLGLWCTVTPLRLHPSSWFNPVITEVNVVRNVFTRPLCGARGIWANACRDGWNASKLTIVPLTPNSRNTAKGLVIGKWWMHRTPIPRYFKKDWGASWTCHP